MADRDEGAGNKTGRPSKYDPAYCEAVIDHMACGASLTSFAADINVARSTINEWMGAHPAFSEAVKRAKAKCAAWWERQGRQLAVDGGGNATLVIFGLKNMADEDWREKQAIEHTGKVEIKEISDVERARWVAFQLAKGAKE